MENQWNKLEGEKITMLNGRCVINALASKRREITEDELLECFVASTDVQHSLVQHELNRILAIGVANGFIAKNCENKYELPSLDKVYVTDGDPNISGQSTPRSDRKRPFLRSEDVVITAANSAARRLSVIHALPSARPSVARPSVASPSAARPSAAHPSAARPSAAASSSSNTRSSRKRKFPASRSTPPPKAKQPKVGERIGQPRKSTRKTSAPKRYGR